MIAFEIERPEDLTPRSPLLPVGSGKGGVGKTLFSANLALQLGRTGKRILLVDLDLGGSNLHTALGIPNRHSGMGDFLRSGNDSLESYIQTTPYPGVFLIPGDQLYPDTASFSNNHKSRIFSALAKVEFDGVILDLGAGSHSLAVDAFLMSHQGILLTTPGHGAVQNAFAFVKTAVYRLMVRFFEGPEYYSILEKVFRRDEKGKAPAFWEILQELSARDELRAVAFRERLERFKPFLFLNRVASSADLSFLRDLIQNIYQKTAVDPRILGYFPDEKALGESTVKRLPFLLQCPDSKSSKLLPELADRLLARLPDARPALEITLQDLERAIA